MPEMTKETHAKHPDSGLVSRFARRQALPGIMGRSALLRWLGGAAMLFLLLLSASPSLAANPHSDNSQQLEADAVYHQTDFLSAGCFTHTFAGLSASARSSCLNAIASRGYTHFYLYAYNENDYGGPSFNFYNDPLTFRARLQEIRDRGLAPVVWLVPDDAPVMANKSTSEIQAMMNQLIPQIDGLVSSYVLGLELDEYWSAGKVDDLGKHLRTLTDKMIGVHMVPGKWSYCKFGWCDYMVLQLGFGKSESFVKSMTSQAISDLGKPVVAGEYWRPQDGIDGGWHLGDAGVSAGASGFGNGGTVLPPLPLDTTPPSMPLEVVATPVSQSQIDLAWQAAEDPESGVAGYNIYRDGVRIATVAGASYSDTGLDEGASYTYEITAVNGAGIEGPKSAPVGAATLPDVTAPGIEGVTAPSSTQVVLVFTEPVEETSASNPANYAIGNGVQLLSASLGADQRTVSIATSAHLSSGTYILTVNGVRDRARQPNLIAANTQASYSFVAAVNVMNLAAISGRVYQVGGQGIGIGADAYTDRDYKFTAVPAELVGATYIKTANADKSQTAADFLSFTVEQNVSLALAYDTRALSLPDWLSGWTQAESLIQTADTAYKLFYKDFSAGQITIGANSAAGAANDGGKISNYVLALIGANAGEPDPPEEPAPPAPNQPPAASIAASATSGQAPLVVLFDATGSSDPDGQIVGVDWDFGDGASGQGASVSHQYGLAGSYTVTLTVTDNIGATASASVLIHVGQGLPQMPGMASPVRDLNGDGLAEDINGNGRLDFNDVVLLFQHLDSEAVQGNLLLFDFDGNGEVNTADVAVLFGRLSAA